MRWQYRPSVLCPELLAVLLEAIDWSTQEKALRVEQALLRRSSLEERVREMGRWGNAFDHTADAFAFATQAFEQHEAQQLLLKPDRLDRLLQQTRLARGRVSAIGTPSGSGTWWSRLAQS